jgi:hypothetical protein
MTDNRPTEVGFYMIDGVTRDVTRKTINMEGHTWHEIADGFLDFLRGCGFVIGYNYSLEPVCYLCGNGPEQHEGCAKCSNEKKEVGQVPDGLYEDRVTEAWK